MQPQAQQNNQQFVPKWRHFHPQSIVWVQNPFEHDIVFQVADERNVPFQYTMPAGKLSELPGGAIATLGVKAIVDELIQSTPDQALRMWEADVRAAHEEKIIMRIKEAPARGSDVGEGGQVNLGVKDEDKQAEAPTTTSAPEDEEDDFDDLDNFDDEAPTAQVPTAPAVNQPPDPEISSIAAASLGGQNTIIEEE